MKSLRPSTGVTPQEFVQRASVAAWSDEATSRSSADGTPTSARASSHVRVTACRVGGAWRHVPDGSRCPAAALPAMGAGTPGARTGRRAGSFFGPEGEGYVRMAMVATLDDCGRAVEILEDALSEREVHA
jgi:hypothetical protein